MAKWGEGDPRWIVEERPDATNVNNWHWTEKNATPWSKDRLKVLFKDFKISENGFNCNIDEIDTLQGEATANNRKGKLIFFYEWNIVLKWSGMLPNSKDKYSGKATIPNLSEENDLDEIEITITIDDTSDDADKLKMFMYNIGKSKIRDRIGLYLQELKEEYSKDLILPKKGDSNEKIVKPDSVRHITSGFNKINHNNNENDNDNEKIKNCEKNAENIGCKIDVKSLQIKISFQCRSNELYEVLTKPEMVAAFTRGEVKMEPARGGEFVLFGGNVHGRFQELIPNKKIIQTWRLKQWPADHFSSVTIEIEEKDDKTELSLVQTGIPSCEAAATLTNWNRYYFNSIKQTFGFGCFLN